MKPKSNKRLNFDDIRERLTHFLMNFQDPELEEELEEPYNKLGKMKYRIMMQKIANEKLKTFEIYLEDIEEMLRKEEDKFIIEQIKTNVRKYIDIFYDIVEKNRPQRNLQINPEDSFRYELENALEKQRKENIMNAQIGSFTENEMVPPKMHRKYYIIISYKTKKPGMVKSINQLNSNLIGSLIILKGIVVRADEVKPRISVATFTCDVCGNENYMQILNDSFHPITQCESRKCKDNKVNGKLSFIPQHSHFIPSQQIKIQETSDQLKQGNIPRTLKLVLTQTNIRKAQPGDVIQIQGVLLPKRKEGFFHQQDLIFDICIEAFKVSSQKKKYVDMQITDQDKDEVEKIRKKYTQQDLFEKLSKSIAPQIYGMDYVKKALLLLLAGGVTTVTHDRLKIRGQINIMLVGDPGVAKSQLLKQISYLAPRGVYTSGKGSSDVGLTAAIKIDPVNKDVSLEAGALVLADMGVCCIDEFDKMTEYDRTAIHEVMEQQTVSIAKAGITTTLNARTSVLAAANPLFSRYNPNETPQKNINLPAALFSRFDLIFILLDTPNQAKDLQLARHIGMVHKDYGASLVQSEFTPKFLRTYIALSKEFSPKISSDLTSLLIQRYIKKRTYYADRVKQGEQYITTRNLLALIRLCQARARLRFSNEITREDIIECEDIMLESQKNVISEQPDKKELTDDSTAIFSLIKDLCTYKESGIIDYDVVQKRILARGFTMEALSNTVTHYERLDVLIRDVKTNSLRIIK